MSKIIQNKPMYCIMIESNQINQRGLAVRIALIGAGKMGTEIVSLVKKNSEDQMIGPFDEKDQIEAYIPALKLADIVLVFTPGEVVPQIASHLMKIETPVLVGSTGVTWNQEILEYLQKKNRTWMHATNLSLGMSVIRELFKTLVKNSSLMTGAKIEIVETQSIERQKSCSGTALAWQRALSALGNIEIVSHREGQVQGIHSLMIKRETESIEITHNVLEKGIFAEGTLWTAREFLHRPPKQAGLTLFEDWFAGKN